MRPLPIAQTRLEKIARHLRAPMVLARQVPPARKGRAAGRAGSSKAPETAKRKAKRYDKRCDAMPGENKFRYADHAFFTMGHADESHRRSDMAAVMRAAWGCEGSEVASDFRGIVVREWDDDGSIHFHGACWRNRHKTPRRVVEDARAADLWVRGWKEKPEWEQVAVNGGGHGRPQRFEVRPKPGTGAKFHLSVLFHHVYAPDDEAVVTGGRKAGAFKHRWDFNQMVEYLTDASERGDPEPLYINCTPANIGVHGRGMPRTGPLRRSPLRRSNAQFFV